MAERLTEMGIVTLTALGWAVVTYTVLMLPVSPGSQAILYTSGLVALAGTTALFLEVCGWRAGTPGDSGGAARFLGTGMRLALAAEFALWLQSLRMLSLAYLVLIAAVFAFIELLFRQVSAGDRSGTPR